MTVFDPTVFDPTVSLGIFAWAKCGRFRLRQKDPFPLYWVAVADRAG
jgi:hypothetical protein